MTHEHHHRSAPASAGVAIVTVSDTRTQASDASGHLARELFEDAGHVVRDQRIVKDEPDQVRAVIRELAARSDVRVVLLTGGTGISRRDRTFEAVSSLLDRRLDGFGEIFRSLSYAEIGSSAMLSRAVAGLIGGTAVFSVPGSTAAVRLALERLVLPELGHLVGEIDKDNAP